MTETLQDLAIDPGVISGCVFFLTLLAAIPPNHLRRVNTPGRKKVTI